MLCNVMFSFVLCLYHIQYRKQWSFVINVVNPFETQFFNLPTIRNKNKIYLFSFQKGEWLPQTKMIGEKNNNLKHTHAEPFSTVILFLVYLYELHKVSNLNYKIRLKQTSKSTFPTLIFFRKFQILKEILTNFLMRRPLHSINTLILHSSKQSFFMIPMD